MGLSGGGGKKRRRNVWHEAGVCETAGVGNRLS